MSGTTYTHWQPSTLTRLVFLAVIGLIAFVGFDLARAGVAWPWIVPAAGLAAVVALGLLVAFHGLGTEIDANGLRVWFGPGWIHRYIPAREIVGVETTRNRWWMGWGIRLLGRSWTLWSVSGLDAVALRLRSGETFRIGTDDSEALAEAIRSQLTRTAS